LLPADGREAARWSVGVMELGALVCTAREPSCRTCPLAGQCAWLQLGRPAGTPGRKAPGYQGSDRQCRGALMAVLRDAHRPVPAEVLAVAWDDSGQRARSLAALIADGLVIRCADGSLALPGEGG
jgi:A/G-specific adenine glycosylase